MNIVNKKIEPYVFISVDEWKRQLEKNNAYIIEETGEHFIYGWDTKKSQSFGQTVKIHPVLRMNYMKIKEEEYIRPTNIYPATEKGG